MSLKHYLPRFKRTVTNSVAMWFILPPKWGQTWWHVASDRSLWRVLLRWLLDWSTRRADVRRGLTSLEMQMLVTAIDPCWNIHTLTFHQWVVTNEIEIRRTIQTDSRFKGYEYFANPWLIKFGIMPM